MGEKREYACITTSFGWVFGSENMGGLCILLGSGSFLSVGVLSRLLRKTYLVNMEFFKIHSDHTLSLMCCTTMVYEAILLSEFYIDSHGPFGDYTLAPNPGHSTAFHLPHPSFHWSS